MNDGPREITAARMLVARRRTLVTTSVLIAPLFLGGLVVALHSPMFILPVGMGIGALAVIVARVLWLLRFGRQVYTIEGNTTPFSRHAASYDGVPPTRAPENRSERRRRAALLRRGLQPVEQSKPN